MSWRSRWPGCGTAALSADLPALRPAELARALTGAAELDLEGVPGLRRDVDTPADLRAAAALGLGPYTAPLAAELLRCAPQGR